MRKSVLVRDYPGQKIFPGEEGAIFVVPLCVPSTAGRLAHGVLGRVALLRTGCRV